MKNLKVYFKEHLHLYIAMFIMCFTWYAQQFFDFLKTMSNYTQWLSSFDPLRLLYFVPLFILIIYVLYVFSKNSIKDIIKVFFHVWLVFFILVFILGNLKLLPEIFPRHKRVGFDLDILINNIKNSFNFSEAADNDLRWDFGFNYPTVGALAYTGLLLSFVYVYQDKLTKKHYLIIMGLSLFFYMYSLVRAMLILIPLLLILMFGNELKKYVDKYGKLFYLIIPFGLLFSFIAPLFLENNKIMDAITSGRFELWAMYIKEMPIKLLNLTPDMKVFSSQSLDNAYLFPIFFIGVIPAILIFIGFTLLIKDALARKDHYLLYIFFIWSAYGFIEPTYFYNYNFLIYASVPVLAGHTIDLIKKYRH